MTDLVQNHHGISDPSMLERIDALFACGAGEHVSIPQIIVVGDQSSGKSSVLSGLIRKNLPRDSSLCTRFATKIIFRRASETGVRLCIIPDDASSQEHRACVAAFGRITYDSLDDIDFEDIMKDVKETIGIATSQDDPIGTPTFSADVLQLEISGPNEEHLSVIDVPGIFRDHTPGVTTKDDICFVRNMIMRYMGNPRSVMLAVLPANVDIATQEILQLASEVDPDEDRTLGVLTKPDLVDEGAEENVLKLLEGRVRPMKLGWHILRNPGQKDIGNDSHSRERQEEEFFARTPWRRLDKDKVGIESLRHRLMEVLSDLVMREFTNVKIEVQNQLNTAERRLRALGVERNSGPAQRAFLADVTTKFQHLVDLALLTNFGANKTFEDSDNRSLRIAPAVVQRMEEFYRDMMKWGHVYSFKTTKHGSDAARHAEIPRHPIEREAEPRFRKETQPFLDLEDVYPMSDKFRRSCDTTSTKDWLRQLHSENRGFKLGTFDPVILSAAMRKQTPNWRGITYGFVSDIITIVHKFIRKALAAVCRNQRLENELYNLIFDDIKEGYKKAIETADFILDVELDGTPMTQNPYFIDQLNSSRDGRYKQRLDESAIYDQAYGMIVKLDGIKLDNASTNNRFILTSIHDILHAYYEVARIRFIDNICNQVASQFLVNGPHTPLRVLSARLVSQLSDEKMERIAGEEPKVKRKREKLHKDIKSLQEAKRVLS